MAKPKKNKAPKNRDIDRLEKFETDMSHLTSGPYPPIRWGGISNQLTPLSLPSFFDTLFGSTPEQKEPTDCVKDAWEDREAYPTFYHHNAYTSIEMGDSTAGMLVSVVKDGQCPDGKPINLCAIHNLTGTVRATFAYFDIESAKQLVNQIGQAISVAEARTKTEA